MRLRPAPSGRRRRLGLAGLRGGVRAVATQGLFADYRRDYWRFLRDVWRTDRSRLAEAIDRAAAGHHFIEYTRRDARPRLEWELGDALTS